MEPPSAPPRGGHVPWQGLLLAVSLLTFWNPPTTAQLTVESVPPNAAEGKDVLLRVHNLPGDLLACNWFRGETVNTSHQIISYVVDTQVTTPGPAHSGRETIYPNGSLLFQRVTLNDTGNYTLQIVRKNAQVEQGTGQIRVFHGLDAPTISPSDSYYHPGTSLMLSCHAASNPPARYSWLVNGRPQTSTQELFIPNVTVNDSGAYTCIASNSGTRLSKTTVKTITVSDGRSTTGLPVGSIIGIAVGVLVALALTVALGCLLLRTRTGRDSGWHDLRELWCPASTPRHGPARSSTYPDSLPSPTTAIPIYQELQHRDTNIYCQINQKAEVAS